MGGGGAVAPSNPDTYCPYAVGDYFYTENETNPATRWAGTTWEKLSGKFLLGANETDVLGVEGGEETHTLTVEEMPSHNHNYYYYDKNITSTEKKSCFSPDFGYNNRKAGALIADTGGNQPHNNMPPYRLVYCWKRIS